MQIAMNTVVMMTYELKDAEGTILESSEDAVAYLHGGYDNIFPKVEEAIVFTEYDSKRVIRAERIGFSNTAAHAQLTRIFQDSVVAFSNQRTLDEIIERASDGKLRIAKMMKRDLGFQSESLAAEIKSEYKKIKQTKNIMLFNRCMDDML